MEIKFERISQSEKWGTYASGMASTDCKFEQKYGFFEAKMLHVYPDGKQSAFWMMPNGGTLGRGTPDGTANDGAEIDIFEGNKQSGRYATNYHYDGYGKYHKR